MSGQTTIQAQSVAKPTFTPVASGLLQRQCACGQHTGSGGECEECKKEREAGVLQRAAIKPSPVNEVPPIVHEVMRSPGQPLDAATRSFMGPRLGHDFSQIRTHTPAGRVIQTKLAINNPGDEYEQEADCIAEQVMATSAHHAVSGAPPRIQRFAWQPSGQIDAAPPTVDRALASPGRPLEPELRQDMEKRFGYDFSHVRVHSDAVAEQSALDVKAHAYTVGQDMVFGAGRFAPGTYEGRRLLAHELTHVVQQSVMHGSQVGRSEGNLDVSLPTFSMKSDKRIMREGFESTIKICHNVLESRNFEVTNGGVRVALLLNQLDTEIPNCQNHTFWVKLTRSVDWGFDDKIATCEAETGGARSFSFGNLSSGTYYLTISRSFDNPYCCLEGDILVFDEPISSNSSSCVHHKGLSFMDIVHGALDIAGFIPVLGAIPDGINAVIYVAEGDWINAGVSAFAMIPAIGDGAKAAVMGGKAAVKISEKAAVKLGEEGLAKAFKEAKAASRLEKEAAEKLEKEAAEKAEKEAAEKTEKEAAEKKKSKSSKCSDAFLALLHEAVKKACKGYSCSMQLDNCASATAKVSAGYACIAAREKMQRDCWKPGDPGYEGHMKQIADVYAANRRCLEVMSEKCKS